MQMIDSVLEIEKIRGVLANFGWKLAKQVITDQGIALTIKKEIPSDGDTKPTE